MPKKLAIYFSDPEPMGYPFDVVFLPYWEIYQGIIRDIEAHGIEVYIVRGHSYLGNGSFSHGWMVKNAAMIPIDGSITVDLVFNRDDKNTIPAIYDCQIINRPDLDRICVDKFETAALFPEMSIKTEGINSYKEFLEVVNRWDVRPEEKIVVKKNFLSSGHGIFIRPVKEISESLYQSWNNILVQEFVDSSVGIPSIVEGLHDIRVVTINSEPVYTFVRIPKEGSFLANLAQGAKELPLSVAALPTNLLEMVAKINKKLSQYKPSIFASDFMNSKDGFKLVELNSRPTVCNPLTSQEAKNYIDKIVQLLVGQLS